MPVKIYESLLISLSKIPNVIRMYTANETMLIDVVFVFVMCICVCEGSGVFKYIYLDLWIQVGMCVYVLVRVYE